MELTFDRARRHLMTPAQDLTTLGETALPRIARAEGIYVYFEDGKRVIDGPAGMWCTQVGYGAEEIVTAMADQARSLCYNSPWYTVNGAAAELAERIAGFAPGDLNRVFFTTGGSTAVDSALRLVEFVNNHEGQPQKKNIIVRRQGYHGSTKLTASCSGRAGNWPHFDIASPHIHFISAPSWTGQDEAERLDELVAEFRTKVEELGPETVAAFLAEPLLASGGVIIPPRGYHASIKEICEEHGIIYISDEVVTGFGRCGAWFASEEMFGVVPDIITFAKGITSGYVPLGGFVVSERLMDRISGQNARGAYFTNGYTYSGHPVACAAALANLDLIEKRRLIEKVRSQTGPAFAAMLESLRDHPHVADVRHAGLVGCLDISLDPEGRQRHEHDKLLAGRVDALCLQKGLLVRPLGDMCVLSPALIIEPDEIAHMGAILRAALSEAVDQYHAGGIPGLAPPAPAFA